MNGKLSFLLKQSGVFLGCLFLASGSTYGVIYANKGETKIVGVNDKDTPMTPAEKLMASIMELKLFSVDADLNFTDISSGNAGKLAVDGYADLSSYEDIKVSGDMVFTYGYSSVSGTLGYFDDTVYVDYNTSYLKMETSEMSGVMDVLKGAGINISLPEELTNLDLNKITDDLEAMEPERTNNGYLFTLPISDLVTIYFISDATDEYNFTGIKTNNFYYGDLYTSLEMKVEELENGSVALVNPEKVEGAPVYNNFKPAFNLVAGVTEFLKEDKNNVKLALDLKKDNGTEKKDFISLAMDLSYNLGVNQYALDATIKETAHRKTTEYGEIVDSLTEGDPSLNGTITEKDVVRTHEFSAYIFNDALYIDHAKNKISFEMDNINMAIDYILTLIDEEALDGVLADLVSGMDGVNINELLANLKNLNSWISAIEIIEGEEGQEDRTAITFDLSIFGLDTPSFTLYANSEQDKFLGIGIEEFTYNGYSASFYLGVETYSMRIPEVKSYVVCDYVIGLIPGVINLIDDTQFRVDLSGEVASADKKSIGIAGGFQFDIADDYGYGDLTITDRDDYAHKIVADYSAIKTIVTNEDGSTSEKISDGDLFLTYNDKLKAKMDNSEMKDLIGAVGDIAGTRDEHFYELFGDLVKNLTSTPIYYAIANKEYGILFDSDLLSNIRFTDNGDTGLMEFDVSGDIIGLDCVMNIGISYGIDCIKDITANNIVFGDTTISFKASIGTFDPELNASRLSKEDFVNAMELADLTTVLNFGINTSQYDGYRFSSEKAANVTFSILGIDAISLDIPLDIKVDNYKGDVSIAVEMSNIPIFDTLLFNLNGNPDYEETESRSASIYYQDGKVYMKRVDKVYDSELIKPSWNPFKWYTEYTHYDVTYECVAETQYFFDNIMHYLVELILGVENGTVLDAINGSSSGSGSSYQIPYEDIVKSFDYDDAASRFTVDIDLAALANNEDLSSFTVIAGVDKTKEELSYLDVKLGVSLVGVTIGVSANLPLTETYQNSYREGGDCLDMSALTSYVASASSHTLNEEIVTPVVTSVTKG